MCSFFMLMKLKQPKLDNMVSNFKMQEKKKGPSI